ncbi:glucose/arabinose dehydrogenase [Kribbella sp. VKM Ac-2527]|uniref:Glucose/arabinose dehydrogenase n=1 Tax=Kribbella caucasensis TaxID=2512215 RepID=A0A4R6KGS1_9ACTN|nr:ThuA domain-containing protein [Kribbella sp. VKM Ac-2527]TDO48659.1 glucose/arabinose dehydrogenase [Kribbella sp. VKM Ac-2527]
MSQLRRRLHGHLVRAVVLALIAVLAIPLTAGPARAHPGHGDETFNALIFSKTAGFRHDSIPAGIQAIRDLATENGFTVTATEDSTMFNDTELAKYEVVIWLSTTGDVLTGDQQAAFERYIRGGGGYAGVHAASDTEYDWPWYGKLVGSYFDSHPPGTPNANVKVEDHAHPSTTEAPTTWNRTDEWYNYRTNPRDTVHVLASLDESSYTGGNMGVEHPIAWCQDYDGGRAWYTGMGHTIESFAEPAFRKHLLGGIRTAAGVENADCGASLSDSYQKVTLDDDSSNPMELAIATDGRVFYIDRNGAVKIVKTDGSVVTAGTLNVYTGQEFGLLGLALDPAFDQNGFLYLYYSPAGSSPVDKVSRFKVTGDTLDLASEMEVLRIDTQRDQCCHAGGALEFDGQGNLFIATGDNSNPFDSDGYSPIDERAGRAAWDAQRSAANSNNLNGKVLRIHPEADGSYTVPAGNLFPAGTAKTRPEIYAMGFRNPFRIGIDPTTNHLFVADYGPDAGQVSPTRGPDGRVEWDIVDKPGFYGWPYCVGNNTPYNDYDFATGTSGATFNCNAPVNNSPNNTGINQLPAAIPSTLWMGKSTTGVPEIGGSGAPMTSGGYQYNPDSDSDRKWPKYFDGKAVFADWNDSRLFSVQLTDDRAKVADVSRMLQKLSFIRPHALQFGPDGALYVIEWGSGFGGNNADSGLYRIDYVQGNRAPIAQFTTDKTSGPAPLTVAFDSAGSRDPDGQPITLAWDFDGNGTTDSTEAKPTYTYTSAGVFTARLTVSDSDGRTAVSNRTITSGNTAPTITVEAPVDGGFFDFGDTIRYKVTVTDPEDGTVNCQDVVTQPALGHDEHAHGYEQYHGCEGTFPLPGDEGHVGANIFGIVTVTYTDKGAPGTGRITTQKVVQLQPKTREAEYFDETGGPGSAPGVQVEDTGDVAGGGKNIGWIEDGDWWGWNPTNLTGIDQLQLRAASPESGATVQVRTGSPVDGPVVATIQVSATGAWQTYGDFTAPVSGAALTSGPLYFVKTTGQLNVNWVKFIGKGVTDNQRPVVTVTGSVAQGKPPLKVDFIATATDPEGDTPLSYEWSFGDGSTGTGASVSHTYQTAGTHTATVTVTDARGAAGTAKFVVKVDSPAPPTCLTGRSDGFEGTSLDTGRWNAVVRGNQELSVAGGNLVLPLTATDIYGTGNTGTPNIVLQPLPAGAWQATTKLTLPARLAYQQAGLIVYGDDDNYAKMVLQGRSTGAPSADARIFQFIREEAGAPNEVAASNTASLGAAYPDTVWVRFTSDGANLRAAYSADGATFTDMPETKQLAGMTNPRIGVFGLANRTEALPIAASFDYFSITPDDTAEVPTPDDEFTGTTLDACRWSAIVRPDPAAYRVTGGVAEIDTGKGDIYAGGNTNPKNLLLQPAPDGDWTIETKVDGSSFDEAYQQAGLLVYADDANYVKLDYLTTNAAGSPVARALELRSEVNDAVVQPAPNAPTPTGGVWYLRLAKSGSTFTGSYSSDGVTWTALPAVTNPALASARFGIYAFGADQVASKTAKFEYFKLVRDTVAPQVSLSLNPSAPSGLDGWWTDAVVATAMGTDNEPGQVYLEQKVGSGDWSEYTAPVTLSADGTHTIAVRASDTAGNVSEPTSVTVKIDRTAPTATVSGLAAGGKLGVASVVGVSAAAEDALSGVAAVTLTVDGRPAGTQLDGVALGLGAHELAATASDTAGNTSVTKVPFTVVVSYAEAAKLVDRYRAANKVPSGTATVLKVQLAVAEQQQRRGRDALAAIALDLFIAKARTVQDVPARTLLISVGQDLKSRL